MGMAATLEPKVEPKKTPAHSRAFWMKQMRVWHWVSSAVSLVGMLAFAITGITLNHASAIPAQPIVTKKEVQVPTPLFSLLKSQPEGKRPLAPELSNWLDDSLEIATSTAEAEWSDGEVYVSLPRPGGDSWLNINRATGVVQYERTDRGLISYLNDLHKGRHTGTAWSWFLDIFAGACVVFCLTGLVLLQLHAGHRPATWPVVALGLAIPLVLAMVFIH
jgi:hypothetical protein